MHPTQRCVQTGTHVVVGGVGPEHDGDGSLSRGHGGWPLLAQTGQGDHMSRESLGRLDLQHLARLWQHHAMSWEERTVNKVLTITDGRLYSA